MSNCSIGQLHAFYAQERVIFSKLVLNFSRSPAESLLVMATLLWLEDFGFEDIFSVIKAHNDSFIAALAYEAVLCFRCLDSDNPPNGFNQIPLTAKYMKKNISLQIIYQHRYIAITGIKNFLTTVCSRIFSDILQQLFSSSSSSNFIRFHHYFVIPSFLHCTFESINGMPSITSLDDFLPKKLFSIPSGIWGWNATCITTENDRTLFLTFSRGYPVSEAEVKQLFVEKYGENCVKGVYMNSYGQQQSLYARLVLDSVVTVDRILKGEYKKRFHINGKHIWARKFEDRLRKERQLLN